MADELTEYLRPEIASGLGSMELVAKFVVEGFHEPGDRPAKLRPVDQQVNGWPVLSLLGAGPVPRRLSGRGALRPAVPLRAGDRVHRSASVRGVAIRSGAGI